MLWAYFAPQSLNTRIPAITASEVSQHGHSVRVLGKRYASSLVVQRSARLLADAQLLNDGFVAFGIRLSEVVEQAATLADHHEKPAPGGMVLLVGLEMLGQFANPCAQDGDLNFRGTGIVIRSPVVGNQGGFFLSG